ncbi:MAG: RnfABCDGE type electron transport complex subunit B [Neisseriales bacterium]|nr:MAG: RnfABCDGE type electron transport complex subunit B [Neisseriales bacterium]
MSELIDKINSILPQTQCTRCGYPSCKDYATAIAEEKADINQCPPGGNEGITLLANMLDKEVKPLNPENGKIEPRRLAIIEEEACIGCTLCIKACPVDAIIGANKMMHTVITSECTGCDLCIPACPVDCIKVVPDPDQIWSMERRNRAQSRFEQHQLRRENEQKARDARLAMQTQLLKKARAASDDNSTKEEKPKADLIAQIMAKAKSTQK